MHPAERLGKYELVRHLASGGMARVYLARVSGVGGFERYVVLKTVRPERIEDQSYVTMFLDEARLVATLHHQHIAQVYEIGVADDGTYFLAMEYLHGETARAVLEHARVQAMRLPLELGLTIACAAAAGLHHAHERRAADGTPLGIVHRDVSPSNVIIGYDGSIKLIDFGIAKAEARSTKTLTGFVKGKAGYMAPEQALGYTVDRRSDVFALGVLLYELTTQTRAFRGTNEYESVQRIVAGDVVPPSKVSPGYPPELEDVVMTALAVDPDDRFQDADAMRRALEMTAHHLGLHLGTATVTRVLGELFGERPEPWMVDDASSTGEEMTYVDVESAPMLAAAPLAPLRLTPIPGGSQHAAMQRHADGGSVVDEIPTSRFITMDPDAPPTPAAPSARKTQTLSSLPPPLPALPPARMATGTAPPKNVASVAIPAVPPGRTRTGQVTVPMPIRVATPPPRVVTQPMVVPAVTPAIAPSTTLPPATPLPPPVSIPMPAGSGQGGVPGAVGSVPAAVPAATVAAATVARQQQSGPVGMIPVEALTPAAVVPRFLPGPVTPGMVSKVGAGTGTEPAMPRSFAGVRLRIAALARQRKVVWAATAAACVLAVGVLAMVVGADGGETLMFRAEGTHVRTAPPAPPAPAPAPRTSPPTTTPAPRGADAPAVEMVTLKVTTSPEGATVVIDGEKVGESPYVGTIEKGREAVVKVRKRKHKPRKIKVTFDQDLVWDVRLPRR